MANPVDTLPNQLAAEEEWKKTCEQYGGSLRRFERRLLEMHSLSLTKKPIDSVTGLMHSRTGRCFHWCRTASAHP